MDQYFQCGRGSFTYILTDLSACYTCAMRAVFFQHLALCIQTSYISTSLHKR